MKYIDAERLKVKLDEHYRNYQSEYMETRAPYTEGIIDGLDLAEQVIDSLQEEQTDMGEVSDGYHTFNELYYYRMLYNAAFFNLLPKGWVHKSKRHHTGEECFCGGWFIVMANLPTGQVSNHYELKDWDLFKVPEKEFADEWDGHTPQEAAERLHKYLQQDETQVDKMLCSQVWWEEQGWIMIPPDATIEGIDSLLRQVKKKLQQEQPESSKGKFAFPKYLYARTTNNKTIDVAYGPQSLDAVEYVRNDYLQQEQPKLDDVKREWYNKGYLKGRKDANIPARELGLPKSCDIQEQPEVDLGKEVSKWWDAFFQGPDFKFRKHRAHIVTNDEIIELARHFYELGRNARKED